MKTTKWQLKRDERIRQSLERHHRLHKLYMEDGMAFERERKRMIDEVINGVTDKKRRDRLRVIQASWDRKMKSAGSPENRFILAQTLFWKHFHEAWCPALGQLRRNYGP